jgi:O-antigen/teichoic acid export membrane protein
MLTVGRYLAGMVGLVTSIIAARGVGPSAFGTAALTMSFPQLVWSFAAVKTTSVTLRYVPGYHKAGRLEELRAICKVGYLIDAGAATLAFAVVVSAGAWVAESLLQVQEFIWLMAVYAASNIFHSLAGTSSSILSSLRRFRVLAVYQIVDKLLILGSMLAFLGAALEVEAVVLGYATGQTISGLLITSLATRALAKTGAGLWWTGSLRALNEIRRELVALFRWSYVFWTLRGAAAQGPVMILGATVSRAAAGYFRLASNMTVSASYLESAISRVSYPRIAEYWAVRDWVAMKALIHRWVTRGSLPAALALSALVPLLTFAIPLVLGSEYSPMVGGAQVLLLAAAISLLFFYVQPFHYSTGRVAFMTKLYGSVVGAEIGLGYLASQHWGFFGMALVFGAGLILFNLAAGFSALRWLDSISFKMNKAGPSLPEERQLPDATQAETMAEPP